MVTVAPEPGARSPTEQETAVVQRTPVDAATRTASTPAGTGSVTVTSRAVDGPGFVTSRVQLSSSPATTVVGARLVRARSADSPTVPTALARSFSELGSVVSLLTAAVLVRVSLNRWVTTPVIATAVPVPVGTTPRSHCTSCPLTVQRPWSG